MLFGIGPTTELDPSIRLLKLPRRKSSGGNVPVIELSNISKLLRRASSEMLRGRVPTMLQRCEMMISVTISAMAVKRTILR